MPNLEDAIKLRGEFHWYLLPQEQSDLLLKISNNQKKKFEDGMIPSQLLQVFWLRGQFPGDKPPTKGMRLDRLYIYLEMGPFRDRQNEYNCKNLLKGIREKFRPLSKKRSIHKLMSLPRWKRRMKHQKLGNIPGAYKKPKKSPGRRYGPGEIDKYIQNRTINKEANNFTIINQD